MMSGEAQVGGSPLRGWFGAGGRRSADAGVVVTVHDGVMTRQGQRRWWMAAGGLLLVAGVIGFLAVQTLDDADKWASVLSAVVAVGGLLISVVTMVGARQSSERSGQSVTGSTVGGGVRQIRGVAGSVRIGSSGPVPAVSLPGIPAAPATGETGEVGAGDDGNGQSVSRSQVSGPVDQIDQVRGDVEFDR